MGSAAQFASGGGWLTEPSLDLFARTAGPSGLEPGIRLPTWHPVDPIRASRFGGGSAELVAGLYFRVQATLPGSLALESCLQQALDICPPWSVRKVKLEQFE